METLNRIIQSLRETGSTVLLLGAFGIALIFIGDILINQNPPSYQIGFPTTAMGFGLFVFAVSIDNSKRSEKKMNQILEKLNAVQEELKKKKESNPELGSEGKNFGE
jgi:hypothetical protein